MDLGDAAPGEIAQDLGMPTNLATHHVTVRTEAGLVVRSEGDRCRTHLRLRSEALATLSRTPLTGVARSV